MVKNSIIKTYVEALEVILGSLHIIERRIGNESATYHIKKDPTIERLIRTATEEIRPKEIQDDDFYGMSPNNDALDSRVRIYNSFYDNKGLDSPEEIKQEVHRLIRDGKKALPSYSNQKSESAA